MNDRSPVITRRRCVDAARLGERLGRHVAHVEALDRDHAGSIGDGCRELAVPDIHRDHRVRAALAQHLGESAGRRAHVEGEASARRRRRTRRGRR